jgi:hypothetical protein
MHGTSALDRVRKKPEVVLMVYGITGGVLESCPRESRDHKIAGRCAALEQPYDRDNTLSIESLEITWESLTADRAGTRLRAKARERT